MKAGQDLGLQEISNIQPLRLIAPSQRVGSDNRGFTNGHPMAALGTATLFLVILTLVGFAAAMYASYYVLRAAIRDGIRDSGLVTPRRGRATEPPLGEPRPSPLPDMRASR
jgi:hypothetical protein